MKFYVLKYPNGKFVRIDYSSGGYPCETDIDNAKIWRDIVEIVKYFNTNFRENFTIHELSFILNRREDIEQVAKTLQTMQGELDVFKESLKNL